MKARSFIKKHTLILGVLFLAAVLVISFTSKPKPAQALGLPFGGMVYWEFPCTCPASAGNMLIYLGLPRPGLYTYSAYGSMLYSDYVVAPGSWLLGSYTPGVQVCWMYAGYFCYPYPNLGLINMVGTSL